MGNCVEEYRKRRQKRLDARKKQTCVDSVDEYKKRRVKRMEERFDASSRLAYGIAKGMGINTEGMEPSDVWEAIKKEDPGAYKSAMSGYGNRKPKGNVSGESGKQGKKSDKKLPGIDNQRSKARNHEHDGSKYKGDPGEVTSGKNGNLKPKSEVSKRIDTGDAKAETRLWETSGGKKGRKENSLSGHVDKDGNLTPERQKVHDEIVQDFFKDKIPQEGKATMTMSGGGPASGKSFIEKEVRKQFGDDTTITVDPDKIKEMLPGYTDMAIETDDAAGHYHEESSALAKRIYQYAIDNNLNVVYDGTGDGSVNSVKKKIKAARDAGYEVNGRYVTVDVDGPSGALVRNEARYQKGVERFENGESDVPPRKPKEEHVRKIHSDVSDIVPEVYDMFDNFELYDNNVPRNQKSVLIGKSKRGGAITLEDGREANMERFLRKGQQGWKFSGGKFGK